MGKIGAVSIRETQFEFTRKHIKPNTVLFLFPLLLLGDGREKTVYSLGFADLGSLEYSEQRDPTSNRAEADNRQQRSSSELPPHTCRHPLPHTYGQTALCTHKTEH